MHKPLSQDEINQYNAIYVCGGSTKYLVERMDEIKFKTTIDEYISGLDKVIEYKLQAYSKLRDKVNRYKKHCQEEDALRKKLNPNNFN